MIFSYRMENRMSRPTLGGLIVERILRDRDGMWRQVLEQKALNRPIGEMLVSSVLSLGVYGAVLGLTSGPAQALSSAVKLPLLFLLTLAICLPTLYLFNLVFGARLSIRQAVALVLVGVTVTGALTLAFAPITLFFLMTAHSYAFFKLLNVAILMLTGFVGLSFMVHGMRGLNRLSGHEPAPRPMPYRPMPGYGQPMPAYPGFHPGVQYPNGGPVPHQVLPQAPVRPADAAPAGAAPAGAAPAATATLTDLPPVQAGATAPVFPNPIAAPAHLNPTAAPAAWPAHAERLAGALERPVNTKLLYVWVLLFGFVGTQLAWTLWPFVGSPDQPFALFRSIEGNFYLNVVQTIGHLLG
jgi:hypothetical protein